MQSDDPHQSAASLSKNVDASIAPDEAIEALRDGPVGALIIASVAAGLLFIGWFAFYFLLFLPRGAIG